MVNYALMYHMSSWDFVTTALRRGANSAHWKPEEPRLGKMRTGPRSLRDMGVGLRKGLSALRTVWFMVYQLGLGYGLHCVPQQIHALKS